jgi:hypothetical protein
MKKLSTTLFLFLLTAGSIFSQSNLTEMKAAKSFGQYNVKTTTLMMSPITFKKPYSQADLGMTSGAGLRNGGIAVAVAGVGMVAGGIAMMLDAGSSYYSYSNNNGYVEEEGSIEGGLGFVLTGVGALATAGGIVMIIIGQKKINRKARASFKVTPASAAFAYRF